jgi:hypothetical protein
MRKECNDCAYKQKVNGYSRECCCHYYLMTGCRRIEDKDGKCLSKLKKG